MVASNLAKHKTTSNVETVQIEPVQQRENYFRCPCAVNVTEQKTGNPLTSHSTEKFNQAVKSRSDYDQYWLKVYNKHSENTNYNLP
jgi:hypothetical protein